MQKNRARSDDAAVHLATKKILNPTVEDSVIGACAMKAVALPDGNVTAGRLLIVPILNALAPEFDVAVRLRPLLSYHVPVVIFDVELESAPSNHRAHPGTFAGLLSNGV